MNVTFSCKHFVRIRPYGEKAVLGANALFVLFALSLSLLFDEAVLGPSMVAVITLKAPKISLADNPSSLQLDPPKFSGAEDSRKP